MTTTKAKINILVDKVDITGALVVDTVSNLFDTTKLPQSREITFDLTKVNEVDSAGLSLLIYWIQRKSTLQEYVFWGLPNSLLRLIGLCRLEPFFGLPQHDR